jgi:hypothetical protein
MNKKVCYDCGKITYDYGFKDKETEQCICIECLIKNNTTNKE